MESDGWNSSGGGEVGTLHPATLWLPLLSVLLRTLLPVVVGSYFIGLREAVLVAFIFVMLPAAVGNIIRYATFTYTIERGELVIRSGLFSRQERRIPLERIQDTEVRRDLLERVFGVATVEVKTAGTEELEASLEVISVVEADRFKAAMVGRQLGMEARPGVLEQQEETLCHMEIKDLALGGATSNMVASVAGLVGTIAYFIFFFRLGSDMEEKIGSSVQFGRWSGFPPELFSDVPVLGPVADFLMGETLFQALILVSGGFLIAMARYVIRYYDYRLIGAGEMLIRRFGLFTRREASLSRRRVQALMLEEGLLRRWFGLTAIRADSAGNRGEEGDEDKREVLVPVLDRQRALEIIGRVMPELETAAPPWNGISPRAVFRGSRKGWALLLLLTLQTAVAVGWPALVWIPAFPLVYYLNYQWFRNTGYWFDEAHFVSRRGWLNRKTLYLPVKNIQNVSVRQTWFDRRLQLATLSVDTAGQTNTGGGAWIRNLPVSEAHRIQQELARKVASTRFVW